MEINLRGKLPNQIAEEDIDLMRVWGEINSAWDDIERLLYRAFDAMLPEETEFATQAIFYSQKAHAARRDMVESLAKYALINRPQTAKNLANAIKRVRARSNDRHKLIHGVWGVGVDIAAGKHGPARIALGANIVPDPGNFYPKERLARVRDEMRDTAKVLREAIGPIENAKLAKLPDLMKRHMELGNLIEAPLDTSPDKSQKQ